MLLEDIDVGESEKDFLIRSEEVRWINPKYRVNHIFGIHCKDFEAQMHLLL